MGKAICMLELSSIARGIETSDYMIKAAQVSLLRSSTVCPGKYMIIVGGDTGAVRASMEAGIAQGGEFVVDSLLIPNVHDQLFPAISGTVEVVGGKGFVVLTGDVGAVRAAVEAAKRESELYVESTVIPRPAPQLLQSLL